MTPERWHRINTLLDEALEHPPEQRTVFLDDACDDPDLRAEVEALLKAEAEAPAFLNSGALALAPPLSGDEDAKDEDDAGTHATSRRVGPYQLIQELGRGGMSVVYRAERADGPFEQTVALKLLPRYFETSDRIARFRAERQILATIDHPNIARLIDGGVTDDGRPYLAMEYVDGLPITTYCEERQLSIEERLTLFQTVCAAVQHAHRSLVVHRDLKPSNILVTDEGRVRLLDFGIAKLLDEDATPITVPITRTGEHLMTPEYAAPEQVRGEAITTATDVYQLGILAYELLTDRRPFRVEGRSLSAIERAILETIPAKPSTAVTQDAPSEATASLPVPPSDWSRRLRGDLDMIVMKALRKEPERRYGSAQDLSNDLERHLQGLPVEARPATWRYRARKFARRHRGTAIATTLIALLIVGYTLTVTVQARRLASERDRAQAAATQAEQVTDLLTDILAAAGPYSSVGPDTPVRTVLETGVDRIRDQKTLSPEVLAELLEVAGRVYTDWGELESARDLLEHARQIVDTTAVSPATQIAVLNSLGNLNVQAGELEAAEPLLRETLRLQSEQPDREESAVASAANDLARVLERLGRLEDAERLYRRAIAIRREHGEKSTDFAANLNNLANLLADRGRPTEAEPLYLEALKIVEAEVGEDHPYAAFLLNALSLTHKELGNRARALKENSRTLDIARERLGPEHPFTATALFNRASLLEEMDRLEEAEALYEKALALRRRILPDDHPEIAYTLVGFGSLLLKESQPREAESLLREAVAIRKAIYPDPHWLTAIAREYLGRALIAQQRYAEAEPLLTKSHASLKAQFGPEDKQTQEATRHLAQLYDAWGKPKQAARYRAPQGN